MFNIIVESVKWNVKKKVELFLNATSMSLSSLELSLLGCLVIRTDFETLTLSDQL